MTKPALRKYRTNAETAEIALQAQQLFTLADHLVTRAEHLRDAAEALIATAHIDIHLWSDHSDIPTQRPLGSHLS